MVAQLRIIRYHPRAAVGDGGLSWAVRRWSQALAEIGADVAIAYDGGTAPSEAGRVEWIHVEHRGPPGFRIPLGFERVLRGADLLVLHSAWTGYNVRAAQVAHARGVRYVLEPRGAYDPHIMRRHRRAKRVWWTAAEARLVRRSAAVHVFFAEEHGHLEALGYRGPIVVAPNGIDAPEPPLWAGGGGGYLLWLGRYDPEHKGLDVLVRALAAIDPAERPTVRLHGGDWRGGKAVLERLVAEQGLGRWVEMGTGIYGPQKRAALVAADGFVYPSRWEGFGNSVLEAVSLGIPALCTPYPLGNHLGQRGGAIVAPATPEGLARGLSVFRDRPRAAAIGAAGAVVALSDFAWPAVAASWLDQVAAIVPAGRGR